MSKQDRAAPRTPADLERMYNFGKRFAEIMGISENASAAAKEAKTAAAEAQKVVNDLDQEAVFNLLTNNGLAEGIFLAENGQIYINASYLAAGILSSVDGKIQINLGEGASIPVFNTGISTNGLTVRSDEAGAQKLFDISAYKGSSGGNYSANMAMNSANGVRLMTLLETFASDFSTPEGVSMYFYNQAHDKYFIIATDAGRAGLFLMDGGKNAGTFMVNADGLSNLTTDKINAKKVSWKDNGDGTYSIVGTD